MFALQIQWAGEQYKHGDPRYQDALWIYPRTWVFEEGQLSQQPEQKWFSYADEWLDLLSFPCSSNTPLYRAVLNRRKIMSSCTYPRWGKLAVRNNRRGTLKIWYWWRCLSFFQQLMKDKPHELSLDLQMDLSVKNLKPAVVKIYDYYQPSNSDTPTQFNLINLIYRDCTTHWQTLLLNRAVQQTEPRIFHNTSPIIWW